MGTPALHVRPTFPVRAPSHRHPLPRVSGSPALRVLWGDPTPWRPSTPLLGWPTCLRQEPPGPPTFLTLLSTPTTLSSGPRQTLGKLTNTLPLGGLLVRESHHHLHKPRSRGCVKLWGVRSPLRSPWCPVYASPVSFGFSPPSQMQHSVQVVGETFPGRDLHPARNAKLRLAH